VNGFVYELDGLAKSAKQLGNSFSSFPPLSYVMKIGPCSTDKNDPSWCDIAFARMQEFLSDFSGGEIHFNLMSVVRRKSLMIEKRMGELEEELALKISMGEDTRDIDNAMLQLKDEMEDDERKHASWRAENVRRRHNYIPFVLSLLRQLARKGHLQPMLDAEEIKAKERHEKEKIREEEEKSLKSDDNEPKRPKKENE